MFWGKGRAAEGQVRVLGSSQEVEVSAEEHFAHFPADGGRRSIVARSNRPFAAVGDLGRAILSHPTVDTASGDDVGVDLTFAQGDARSTVELKLAISFVSLKNARENLESEAGADNFDQVLAKARQSWEETLSRVRIAGGSDKQQAIFYTALYHSFIMPTAFNDVNGEYPGFDGQVHQASGFTYFTDMSLWDTFRTVHPLFTMIAPHEQRDMVVSLVEMAKQGGYLPRWPSGAGESNSMFGSPADIVISETYLKGIRDFDVEAAYQAMRRRPLGLRRRIRDLPVEKGSTSTCSFNTVRPI